MLLPRFELLQTALGRTGAFRTASEKAFEAEIAAELGANKTEPKKAVCWRDALTGTVRSEHARTNKRNKAIIARAIRRFLARAKEADEVKAEAFAVAAANKAAGTDRAGMAKTAVAKVEVARVERGAKRAQSGKTKKIDPATRAAQALKSNPPRVSLGMIDLSKPPTKAVLAEECKARGNLVASKDGSVKELVEWLSSYHKKRNEHQTIIPQMTVGGASKISWRPIADTSITRPPAGTGTRI